MALRPFVVARDPPDLLADILDWLLFVSFDDCCAVDCFESLLWISDVDVLSLCCCVDDSLIELLQNFQSGCAERVGPHGFQRWPITSLAQPKTPFSYPIPEDALLLITTHSLHSHLFLFFLFATFPPKNANPRHGGECRRWRSILRLWRKSFRVFELDEWVKRCGSFAVGSCCESSENLSWGFDLVLGWFGVEKGSCSSSQIVAGGEVLLFVGLSCARKVVVNAVGSWVVSGSIGVWLLVGMLQDWLGRRRVVAGSIGFDCP
ncbi:hypothetical protein Droror1_Dr00014242 [Drosera rotundifolia]